MICENCKQPASSCDCEASTISQPPVEPVGGCVPWTGVQQGYRDGMAYDVQDALGHVVAGCLSEQHARLISAAPDLYAALEGLLADVDDYVRINRLHHGDGGVASHHAMREARAALSKALGE